MCPLCRLCVCVCGCRSNSAGGVQHSAQTPEDERGLRAGRELQEKLQHQRFIRPRRQRERRENRPERHHPNHRYDSCLPPLCSGPVLTGSVFWAEMLLGWSSSCLCDSEDEIRINGGENVLLTSYKDPSLCVWALTHGLTCPPARLFRRKPARLPARRSHDVHHGQSARVRDPLPHLGHREDRVSHTFIIRVPRRSHMLLLQPISSQLPEAHLDECRDGLALNMLAPFSLSQWTQQKAEPLELCDEWQLLF